MSAVLEILRLRPAHTGSLTKLFASIAADESSRRFRPHAFDAEQARRICEHGGKDLYYALAESGDFVGYGMLRGWDEGYEVPSLGIYVAPALRGSGAAVLLMQHLHLCAKLSGSRRVRLTVHKENLAARRLYESLGYSFDESSRSDGQIVGWLECKDSDT